MNKLPIEKQPLRKVVGIDVGIKELLTTSDGIVIKNNKYIEKYEQKILIEKSFGCYRYVYNYFLNKINGKSYINKFDYIKELPLLSSTNEWLKEVDSCLLRCSI